MFYFLQKMLHRIEYCRGQVEVHIERFVALKRVNYAPKLSQSPLDDETIQYEMIPPVRG